MNRYLLLVFTLFAVPTTTSAEMYAGTWNNTTFGSSGSAFFDTSIMFPDVTITADFDGGVFGFGDPPPLVVPGTFDVFGNATFGTMDDPFFGDVAGMLSALGMVDIDITNLPTTGPTPTGFNIFSTSVTGTFTGTAFDLDYVVIFNCGGSTPSACNGPGVGTEGFDFALGTIDASLVIPLPAAVMLFGPAVVGLWGLGRRRRS